MQVAWQLLIWFFPFQKSIDSADFSLVIIICFYGVVAVKTFYICNLVVHFHIAAKVSRHRFKLIVRIGCVNIEFESVPAYLRRNMEMHNQIADVETFYSNYTVSSDDKNQAEINTINNFLDGKKPD